MSDLLNSNQAQDRHGTNRSTTRRWINAGKLSANENGFFLESDFLVLARQSKGWDQRRRNKAAADRLISPELPMAERNQTTGEVLPPSLESASTPGQGSAKVSAATDKVTLGQAIAYEKLKAEKRKNAIASGKLISRTLVERYVGRLGEIDNTEWRSMSSRVTDDLMALCGVSDGDILTRVTRRIDEEVFVILGSVAKAQRDFLASLPTESG